MRVLRALCNQLRGSALSLAGLLCVNVVRLAPLRRGAFSTRRRAAKAGKGRELSETNYRPCEPADAGAVLDEARWRRLVRYSEPLPRRASKLGCHTTHARCS